MKSGIKTAADLAGRRIGVRGYTVTPGVWTRGMLQTVYGLDLNSVTWVLSGDEHVAEYVAPSNVVSSPNSDLVEMLLSGEIDAAIGAGANDSPDIKPLFPDAGEADAQWYKDSGLYPISHMMVVKNQQLEENPWLAGELFSLCNHPGAAGPAMRSPQCSSDRLQNGGAGPRGCPLGRSHRCPESGIHREQRVGFAPSTS